MRGSIVIEKILEVLQHGAEAATGISDAILSGSYRKLNAVRSPDFGDPLRRSSSGASWAAAFRDRQRFYSILAYLKKQGLVESRKDGKSSLWKITKKGLEKLRVLKERNRFAKVSVNYPKNSETGNFKIIVYDIPTEGNQKRRDWLRWALLGLGFKMLQRSVWVGKKKIPEEFLKDLRLRQLLPHVQIFEVSKMGTLKDVA